LLGVVTAYLGNIEDPDRMHYFLGMKELFARHELICHSGVRRVVLHTTVTANWPKANSLSDASRVYEQER